MVLLDSVVDFSSIESKWQKEWDSAKAFSTKSSNKNFYVLEMFPYPSGEGLHMGHALNYIIGDIQARYKRMSGYSVLYPMGYDALGLPAENAAIKAGQHPQDYTKKSIENFITQQKALGISYDWSKLVATCDEDYYKWNQYFFLKFFEKGLVYRKKSAVNWCSKCNTVLANEQVHSGKCWRHGDTDVEIKHLEQWFIKTTAYADELFDKIDELDWPNRIKAMQKNWVGKSFGTEVEFKINGESWPVFTTRPDTIFGVTFVVVSAQHSKLFSLVTPQQKRAVEDFLKKLKSVSEKEMEEMDKEGVFTGSYAINPVTNEKVPVYAGNFVVADYGSGMVMAVPTHDQRDFEFARKYNIPLKLVIQPTASVVFNVDEMKRAYTDEGVLVNSGEFNGLDNRVAIEKITDYLISKGIGKRTVNFKLRDWLISRQRYWGTPIPFVYCEKCGLVPVPISDLPIKLPYDVRFGEGNPLATNSDFVNCKCPKCGGSARRETDTMDTFFDSSWYYLRYPDNKNKEAPFDKEIIKNWLPVNQYIGGAEHACMHLIYARFFTKALRDMGYLDFDEPFTKLFNQGMLHGADGNKMSKSLGNVVNPLTIIKNYSADSLRFNLMSLAAPNSDSVWSDRGMESAFKFVQRVYSVLSEIKLGSSSKLLESKVNRVIKEYSECIENFKYNVGIIKLRELFDFIALEGEISKEDFSSILKLFHPICPHITEELYHARVKNEFISISSWPKCDESKIDNHLEKMEEIVASLRNDILKVKELAKIDKIKKVSLFVAPKWKWDALVIVKEVCKDKPDFSATMKALMSIDEFKKHGGEIQPFIKPAINRLEDFRDLKEFDEVDALNEVKPMLAKEFGVIEIIRAEDSKEAKAKNAFPGKPALIIE